MTRRTPLPGVDALFSSKASPAPSAPAGATRTVKTTIYLPQSQMDLLDDLRGELRKAGVRSMSATALIQAALTMAKRNQAEWMSLATHQEGA